jgi:hypothetical protein
MQEEAFEQIVFTVCQLPDEYLKRILKETRRTLMEETKKTLMEETKRKIRYELYKELHDNVVSLVLNLPDSCRQLVLDDCERQIAEKISMDVCDLLSNESEHIGKRVNNYIFNKYLK